MLPDVLDLYAYTRWADARMLGGVDALTAEQFTRVLGGSFPSVRDTLVHVLQANWVWLSRWKGSADGAVPDLGECNTPALVRARWDELTAAQSAFLDDLTDHALARPIAIRTRSGLATEMPLVDSMRHVANHATYHRGQVTTYLRQLGAKAVSTDLLYWQVERSAARAAATPAPVRFRANSEIAIHVPDLATAEAFYATVLGFRVVSRTTDQLTIDAGALRLYVNRDPGAVISYIPSLDVPDRAAADRHLRDAGVATVGAGTHATTTYYTDPFGLVFDIVARA